MSRALAQSSTFQQVGELSSLAAVAGNPGPLISKLRRAREDAVLVLLGDSTGVPEDLTANPRWFYLLVQYLAAQFPKYTVTYRIWNDTSQAYGSVFTVQTGTSARTLTVYNGSITGSGYDYSFQNSNLTRFQLMLPVAPTTVLLSYGYNFSGTTYRQNMNTTVQWVLGYFPTAEVVVVAQPGKASWDADSSNSLLRSADVRAWALQDGHGLIDAAQPFLDYAAQYGSFDGLIKSDGIHPNSSGMALWFEQARRYFDPILPAAKPRIQAARMDRFFVGPTGFTANTGSPTLDTSPAGIPKWNLPDGASVSISGIVDIPPTWPTANVWVFWSTPGGSTNAVVFYCDQVALTQNLAVAVSGATPSGMTAGNKQTLNSVTISGQTRIVNVYSGARFAAGRPLVFSVRREGADAADTYTGNMWVYGLLVEKGS